MIGISQVWIIPADGTLKRGKAASLSHIPLVIKIPAGRQLLVTGNDELHLVDFGSDFALLVMLNQRHAKSKSVKRG